VVDGAPEPPVHWTKNEQIWIHFQREELRDSRTWRAFGSHLDKDGRFHIEDVPPGKYELELTVNADSCPGVPGPEAMIGLVRTPFTVPEAPAGRPDDPLDLGTITAELFETLKVGDRALDFTVRRIVGKGPGDQLRLGDYQGKLVLLDYWATWCGPCLAEMPAIKDIYWPGLPEVPGGGGFLGAPAAFFLVPVKIMSGPLNPQRDFSRATPAGVTLVSMRFSFMSRFIRKRDNRPSSLTLVPLRSRLERLTKPSGSDASVPSSAYLSLRSRSCKGLHRSRGISTRAIRFPERLSLAG
jgi:thiol-disulfide isomerase/thioredoxin